MLTRAFAVLVSPLLHDEVRSVDIRKGQWPENPFDMANVTRKRFQSSPLCRRRTQELFVSPRPTHLYRTTLCGMPLFFASSRIQWWRRPSMSIVRFKRPELEWRETSKGLGEIFVGVGVILPRHFGEGRQQQRWLRLSCMRGASPRKLSSWGTRGYQSWQ